MEERTYTNQTPWYEMIALLIREGWDVRFTPASLPESDPPGRPGFEFSMTRGDITFAKLCELEFAAGSAFPMSALLRHALRVAAEEGAADED